MKKIIIAIVLVCLAILLGIWGVSRAAPPMCQLTGTVADIYGNVGKPYRISYVGVATQNSSSVIVPGKSSCSANTDNAGNLPSSGPCFQFIQGVVMQVTVGSGQPVQVQVPLQTSADLSTLIIANSDPPSLVSAVTAAAGGDYTLTVTNPPHGTVGQAVIGPGKVTGWQGLAIPSAVPTTNGVPIYSPGASTGWAFGRLSGGGFPPTGLSYCYNQWSSLANGANQNLFWVGDYGGSSAGLLTIYNTYPNAVTMTVYIIAAMGGPATTTFSQLQTVTYGTPAPFTLGVVGGQPHTGAVTYFVTNTSPQTTFGYWWYTPIGGNAQPVCY